MKNFIHSDTLQTTLAVIKPDGVPHANNIFRAIIKNGFQILYRKKLQLSPEQAADFYKENENLKYFSVLVFNLSSGPVEVVILTKENAVDDFLFLLGPEKPSHARSYNPSSLRARFGDISDDFRNAIHGSQNLDDARREIHFFHPNFVVEPISRIKSEQVCCKRETIDALMEGLHNMMKIKPCEPKTWLSNWFLQNNKNRPVITEASEVSNPINSKPPELVHTCKSDKMSSSLSISNSISTSLSSSTSTFSPCSSESNISSSKMTLNKILCCCEMEIRPNETVNCPICDKIIKFSKPGENCGSGAKKKTSVKKSASSSSEKTTYIRCPTKNASSGSDLNVSKYSLKTCISPKTI